MKQYLLSLTIGLLLVSVLASTGIALAQPFTAWGTNNIWLTTDSTAVTLSNNSLPAKPGLNQYLLDIQSDPPASPIDAQIAPILSTADLAVGPGLPELEQQHRPGQTGLQIWVNIN